MQKITRAFLPLGAAVLCYCEVSDLILHKPDLYSFYTSYTLYVVACGPSGVTPPSTTIPTVPRKGLNSFVIPDTGIKTSTKITDVAQPLMLAVIYRNTMAAIAAREYARNSSALCPVCVDEAVKAA